MLQDYSVSIIVPCYNGEKVIKDCLNSIIKQLDNTMELILINNGSTDNTGEILHGYVADNIKIIDIKNNKGVSSARNLGLSEAIGEYVLFYDCDDFIPNGACKKMVNTAKDTVSDVVVANGAFCDDDRITGKTKISDHHNDFECLMCDGVIWNKIYKRKFLLENHIKFNSSYSHGEDTLFLGKIAKNNAKITVIPDIVYHHIMHYNTECENLSRQFTLKNLNEYVSVGIELYSEKYPYDESNIFVCYMNYLRYIWQFWKQIPWDDLKKGFKLIQSYVKINKWEKGNEVDDFNDLVSIWPDHMLKLSYEEYMQHILYYHPTKSQLRDRLCNRGVAEILDLKSLIKLNGAWVIGKLKKKKR